MDLWKRSRTLRIFARILHAKPQAELAGMLEGMEQEKGRLLEDLLALERETPGSLALPVGGMHALRREVHQTGGQALPPSG